MSASAAVTRAGTLAKQARPGAASRLPSWWPLAALTLLAAALRLSTLGLQSLWYDEAFTPVHVLHPSLAATWRAMVHSENSPPLWYLLAWADARVLGVGAIALRLPSALAGIATVPLAWGIGRELAGRRAAILCAAILAVDPLFVWYSQEARAYGLYVFTAALATWCFVRAVREPSVRRMEVFALAGALALLTHYFAVFLLAGMALWLLRAALREEARRRVTLAALAGIGAIGIALLPLIFAQGGHGTQWIGRWPLSERLQAIPQYLLTGYTGKSLGHGIELLVALPLIAGVGLGLWRMLDRPGGRAPADPGPREGALLALWLAACGVLVPLALALAGADYLAPRNLVGAMVPVSALLAVLITWPGTARAGTALGALAVIALLAIAIDVDLSPRLQRGNWHGLADVLGNPTGAPASTGGAGASAGSANAPAGGAGASGTPAPKGTPAPTPSARAITTVELGSAPLEYYLGHLHSLHSGQTALLSEIDETGYAPLRPSAGEPPAPGFTLIARFDVDGLILYRFRAPRPLPVSERELRSYVITQATPEVLVGSGVRVAG